MTDGDQPRKPEFVVSIPPGAMSDPSLETALLDGPPHLQRVARLMAAGHGQALRDWIEAERQRGTSVADVVAVVIEYQVSLLGSTVAQLMPPGGDPLVIKVVKDLADNFLPDVLTQTRAAVAERHRTREAADPAGSR